jgi:hypothetical protein
MVDRPSRLGDVVQHTVQNTVQNTVNAVNWPDIGAAEPEQLGLLGPACVLVVGTDKDL